MSGKWISLCHFGNYIGSNLSPFLRIGFELGRRVPESVGSEMLGSGIVAVEISSD